MRNSEKDAAEMSAKRELMLKTGFKIFSGQVIEAVSMQDVAKACNLGIATLYRYFATKLEFVITIGARQWQEYYIEVQERYRELDGENMNAAQEFEVMKWYKSILDFKGKMSEGKIGDPTPFLKVFFTQ